MSDEDVEGERHVVLEHAGVVGGGLDAGRGVDLAADRLDLLGDLGAPSGVVVPLKAMCSRRCEMPCSLVALASASRRRPRRRARRSRGGACPAVTTVRPDGRRGDADRHRFKPHSSPRRHGRATIILDRIAGRWRCTVKRLLAAHEMRRSRREAAGRRPVAASTASGNFAGWAVASATIGVPGCRKRWPTATPTAVCGSSRKPVSRTVSAHGRGDLRLVGRAGGEIARGSPRAAPSSMAKAPDLREARHQAADRGGVAAIGLEQQPLEVGRDLDVHRRRRGGVHAAHLVAAGLRACGPGCR